MALEATLTRSILADAVGRGVERGAEILMRRLGSGTCDCAGSVEATDLAAIREWRRKGYHGQNQAPCHRVRYNMQCTTRAGYCSGMLTLHAKTRDLKRSYSLLNEAV